MARARLDCPIVIDGQAARSETLVDEAGPHALVLSTTLPDLRLGLHSSYLWHVRADRAQVAHLLLYPNARPFTEAHDPQLEGAADLRGRWLCDHLLRLVDLLREHGIEAVELPQLDATLARLSP